MAETAPLAFYPFRYTGAFLFCSPLNVTDFTAKTFIQKRSRRHPAEFQPITARVLCTSHFIVRLNPLSERFFGKKYCKANSPGESTRYSLALDFFRPGKEIKHDLIVTSINGCLKIIDVAMKPFYIIIHFNIICKFSVFVPKTKSEMK